MKKVIAFILLIFPVGISLASEKLIIPSDAKASYEVLLLEKPSATERILATKRTGPTGLVDYSKIRINCTASTFQGLGEGETLEAMNNHKPTKEGLPVIEGSIKFYQVKYACSQ